MTSALFCLLAVLCVAARSQILDQPFLGLTPVEDVMSFSVVATNITALANQTDSEVNVTPILQLYDIDARRSMILKPVGSRNYSFKFTEGGVYAKTVHFFSAQVVRGHKYSWSVIANNTLGPYHFKLRDYNTSLDTRMIVIADMDNTINALPTWQALARIDLSTVDGLIHAGDFAYNVNSDQGLKGDLFFNSLSNIVTKVPYLVVAGNHENFDNTRFFNYRFRMPQYNPDWDNNVYTVLENNALFLFVNYDWFLKVHKTRLQQTLLYTQSLLEQWKDDRRVRWRVVVSHRPIYCGYTEREECMVNPFYLKAFEDTYRKYKFDLFISAHEHIYERLKVMDSFVKVEQQYVKRGGNLTTVKDPTQPIMVINGLSGGEKLVKEWQTHKINDFNYAGAQTYLDLRFNEDHFEVRCMHSEGGYLVDGVRITKTTPFDGSKKGFLHQIPVFVIVAVLLIVLAGAYFLLRYLAVKNDERRRSMSMLAHNREDRLEDAEAIASLNRKALQGSDSLDQSSHHNSSYI